MMGNTVDFGECEKMRGIMVIALLTVPARDYDDYPECVREWIDRQTGLEPMETRDLARRRFCARHPLTSRIAGFASCILRRQGHAIHCVDIRFGCGAESESIAAISSAFVLQSGPIVGYLPGPMGIQYLLARLMAAGGRPAFDLTRLSRDWIDLRYTISPDTAAGDLPLHVAVTGLGLEDAPPPPADTWLADAFRRRDRPGIADVLLERLEESAAVYVHAYAGAEIRVVPIPLDGASLVRLQSN